MFTTGFFTYTKNTRRKSGQKPYLLRPMTAKTNAERFFDAIDTLITNGIDVDANALQDEPGKKMDPTDNEAWARAADRAEALVKEHGLN